MLPLCVTGVTSPNEQCRDAFDAEPHSTGRRFTPAKLVERTIKEFGRLDILVNNAAYQMAIHDLQDYTVKRIDRAYRTNDCSCTVRSCPQFETSDSRLRRARWCGCRSQIARFDLPPASSDSRRTQVPLRFDCSRRQIVQGNDCSRHLPTARCEQASMIARHDSIRPHRNVQAEPA